MELFLFIPFFLFLAAVSYFDHTERKIPRVLCVAASLLGMIGWAHLSFIVLIGNLFIAVIIYLVLTEVRKQGEIITGSDMIGGGDINLAFTCCVFVGLWFFPLFAVAGAYGSMWNYFYRHKYAFAPFVFLSFISFTYFGIF